MRLAARTLQPQERHVNVSARFARAQASFFLYTTHGDGNYATIELEEQREYKNDRDCIRRVVKELHEEDANGKRERETHTNTRRDKAQNYLSIYLWWDCFYIDPKDG